MNLPKDRVITETQMQNMADPPIGVLFFNSTREIFVVNNGNMWVEVLNSGQLWNILMHEDFEDGTIPVSMNAVDDSNNAFKVGTAEKYEGSYGLYVSKDNGVSASYSKNNICHIYFDVTLPSNISSWRLRSMWKGVAEVNYDYARVYIDETASYVPSAGSLPSTSSTLYQIGNSEYNNQSSWVENIIDQDNSLAGTTIRIIISFRSDGSVQNSPSFCLDNFYVESLS